jgi:hypothetical protein
MKRFWKSNKNNLLTSYKREKYKYWEDEFNNLVSDNIQYTFTR